MRLVRFAIDGRIKSGTIEDDSAVAGGERWPLARVKLLAPCVPSKIIGVGRNYADHAAELGNALPKEPLLFLKAPSALNDPDGDIVYPSQSRRVDYEGELAVVIGKRCHGVPKSQAFDVVAGYTVCNDVTARDLQESDGQWARAKGFDTFAPLGPWIVTGLDPAALRVRTSLNGTLRQDCPTSKLIFDVPTLIEYISAAFTLEPGDVIATGTPSGIGPMQRGDQVSVEIAGIGTLTNRVV
ncbi:MAG TPA: fumarylacetoacetate hydrolase family protein [Candidatus Eremiobacteraceae bacterium]|nr:fumarylacetoacetate hydrolase family protein [Candidatus Eremiobacteraceae bacterium]